MSAELPLVLGELAPGFARFLVLLALLGVASIVLAIVGLCVAASALIALGVYGLLEYVGSRD